jgi:hypothetical protein
MLLLLLVVMARAQMRQMDFSVANMRAVTPWVGCCSWLRWQQHIRHGQ